MIVKMKKITLLVTESQRQGLVDRLRKLGIVHIKNLVKPSFQEIEMVEALVSQIQRAVDILSRYKTASPVDKIDYDKSEIPHKANEIVKGLREKDDLLRKIHDIENQLEWFKPWGGFSPEDIQALKDKGIFVRLYRAPKAQFKKVGLRSDIHIVRQDKRYINFAQVSQNPEAGLDFDEIKLPAVSYESLQHKHQNYQKRVERIDYLLKREARSVHCLKEYLVNLQARQEFLNVMHGMKEEEKFSYLQGFCPDDKVKNIISLAKQENFGYLIENPSQEDDVPTLVRNPKWIRIINPVFQFMNTIPGYREYDISFWFLMFFSLFFAMLIGDAGYGVLFLIATLFAQSKLKKVPREPFILMYVLSTSTIIWGAITGTWFGAEKIAELPFFKFLIIEKISSFGSDDLNFMLYLSFIIGAVQLTIGRLINVARFINSFKALAQVGWISIIWGMFFLSGTLICNLGFPAYAKYFFIVGPALVLLFSNFQKNIIRGILNSLITAPLDIIGTFGNVVSYFRLAAVGFASVTLASTFNNLASLAGFSSIIAGLGAALILFFGHALNITLGFMAVIVHGVRLNMLEFSGQIGMEWSGKEYDPFREKSIVE